MSGTKPIVEKLLTILSCTYATYLKTQTYHWNVTGPNFPSYHIMLETQYEDLAEAVDMIAERVRVFGEKIPSSFTFLKDNSSVDVNTFPDDAIAMIKDLAKSHELVIEELKNLIKHCDDCPATEDLCTERLRIHEKTLWMLKSTIG